MKNLLQSLLSSYLLAITLVSLLLTTSRAQTQTFTTLYSFSRTPDGGYPYAGLIRDAAGNLYGTTNIGGSICDPPRGCGTVFKLDTTGKESVLYSFGGKGGKYPVAGLIPDGAGGLYGTTTKGGVFRQGTVFKLTTTGQIKVLYSFGGADGQSPKAGLVRDAAGNLYGTTPTGGAFNAGTVFKLDTTGKETVLHSFTGGADGGDPWAGLVRDPAGNLYGTSYLGGDFTCNCGTVFKLDSVGNYTLLHTFTGSPDGAFSFASLIRDRAGNLYGTTAEGGDLSCDPRPFGTGCGTVFKLDSSGQYTVLHSFTGVGEGTYATASLVRDPAGNLYGTTITGDASGNCDCGTVFMLDTTGNQTVLHNFAPPEGYYPGGGLIRDAAGNLYGTTFFGGAAGYGTVFKLTP
jgi:uncharacterized repeat protein (TIGR03803 family)